MTTWIYSQTVSTDMVADLGRLEVERQIESDARDYAQAQGVDLRDGDPHVSTFPLVWTEMDDGPSLVDPLLAEEGEAIAAFRLVMMWPHARPR